jgi:hypothetical protein
MQAARPNVPASMGKASKKRNCPAVGGIISPAECGEGRHSRHRCPVDCDHNPFAPRNYKQLLAIEDGLDRKVFRWMGRDDPERDPGLIDRVDRAKDESGEHGVHATIVMHFFFHRGASGLTPAERLERAGFPGMGNDERNLFRAKMRMRVTLIEVRGVLDESATEVVDLLGDPAKPIIIFDRSFSARAVRFATLLCWVYPLPHFCRLSGTAISLADLGPFSPEQVIAETTRHLGGPADRDALSRWYAENFVRIERSINATATERLRRMCTAIDAQWGQATYDLRVPVAECIAGLKGEPSIEQAPLNPSERAEGFTTAWAWFDDSPEAKRQAMNAGRPLLGTILIGTASCRLVCSSADRMQRLQTDFEKRMGDRVRFNRERRDNLGLRLAESLPPPADPALIPPQLLEGISAPAHTTSKIEAAPPADAANLAQWVRESQWKTFADEPVPMLDNRTPREAANDPALRPRLIQLMKTHVRGVDEDNLRKGTSANINPLLRELGLHEIDFPPPTRRAPPPEEEEDIDDEEGDFADEGSEAGGGRMGGEGPLLPPLPADRPLTREEAQDRLRAAMAAFDTAAEGLALMEESGTILDDLAFAVGGLLEPDDLNYLLPLVIAVWFALVPRGAHPLPLTRAGLERAFRREIEAYIAGDGSVFDKILRRHRQPELAVLLLKQCLGSFSRMPPKAKPTSERQAMIALVLCVFVNELDRAVRG